MNPIKILISVFSGKKGGEKSLPETPSAESVARKLCIVCASASGEAFSLKCNAPQNLRFDPVTGESRRAWDYCSTHRPQSPRADVCGIDGTWFVPVEFITVGRTK